MAERSVVFDRLHNAIDANGNMKVASASMPSTATPVTSSSGNVANASAVGTLPAVAARTNYITGFQITGAGATVAANVVATLVGLISGTASYIVTAPTGATAGIPPIDVRFTTPVPASAVNTAIVLTLPALGAGNTHAAVSVQGFLI